MTIGHLVSIYWANCESGCYPDSLGHPPRLTWAMVGQCGFKKAGLLLGDLKRAPQQAHGDPAPLSAKSLTRGRRLGLYQFIANQVQKSVLKQGQMLMLRLTECY